MRPHEVSNHRELFKGEFFIPDTRESGIVNVSPSFSAAWTSITQVVPLVVECSLDRIPPCVWLIWKRNNFLEGVAGAKLIAKDYANVLNCQLSSEAFSVTDNRGNVHISLEKFENAALFIRFGLPSTLVNPSRNRSFSKAQFKPEEFENAGFAFWRGRKTFWKRSFSKTMYVVTITMWFPWPDKSKMTGDYCVFRVFRRSVHQRNPRFKFPRGNVDGGVKVVDEAKLIAYD